MSKEKFGQYVRRIVTNADGVRYAVATYDQSEGYYRQYSSSVEYRIKNPTELLSYPTRRQALRRARYIYGVGGRLAHYGRRTTIGALLRGI